MLEAGGIELLPPWPLFLAFALAGLALNLVPGADMAYVIASAARRGASAGLAASLGVGAGALGHTLLAVVGISALIASSPLVFDAVKWLGAAYLVYLAVELARTRASAVQKDRTSGDEGFWPIFRGGALVNLLNPKVALFFIAFLPQFIDPHAAFLPQALLLGLTAMAMGATTDSIYAVLAGRAQNLLSRRRMLAINRIGGACLIGGGIWLAFTRTR
jgi:threonine/homoserine/homoserine lactone efflux protein